MILAVHSFLPIRLFLLRKVILIKFYLLTVNQIPCLQKEEDHATQELTGGGDADYYGGVEPSQPTTSSPSFTQISPAMLSEEEFSLAGITITFNSGTTISVKRATPGGVIKMLRDYERKDALQCQHRQRVHHAKAQLLDALFLLVRQRQGETFEPVR